MDTSENRDLIKRLHFLSTQLDDMEMAGDRYELVTQLEVTEDIPLLRAYLLNLSTNSENGQWTFDETILTVIHACPPGPVLDAVCSELDHLGVSPYMVVHVFLIVRVLWDNHPIEFVSALPKIPRQKRDALQIMLEQSYDEFASAIDALRDTA